MSDFYTEQLIKKRTDGKDIMKKTVLIALTVISFFAAFLFPLLMLLPVIMIDQRIPHSYRPSSALPESYNAAQ